MGMLLYGLKNIYRNKLRTFMVVSLVSLPFFSVLMMVAMEEGIDAQITKVKENIGNLIQLKPKGAFGTVNIAGGLNKPLPEKMVHQLKSIEHVINVVPYLTAIEPIAGYYMTLHIGRESRHGLCQQPLCCVKSTEAEPDRNYWICIKNGWVFLITWIVRSELILSLRLSKQLGPRPINIK